MSLFKVLSGGKKKNASTKEKKQQAFDPNKIFPKLIVLNPEEFPEDEFYILNYKHNTLPPLKENQLQLHTYEVCNLDNNQVQVTAFIRHGVNAEIQLENASIVLRDGNEQSLLKQMFTLHDLGALPACTSFPYHFIFDISTLPEEKRNNMDGWKIGRAHV